MSLKSNWRLLGILNFQTRGSNPLHLTMSKVYLVASIVIFVFIGYFFLKKHEFSYRLTDYKGNVIYCDNFEFSDGGSSVIVLLSTGDTIQMDSVINIESIN